MTYDATLKLVTNLDRTGVEDLLARARGMAGDRGLSDLEATLAGVERMSTEEVGAAVARALEATSGVEGAGDLRALIELAELNLPNLG